MLSALRPFPSVSIWQSERGALKLLSSLVVGAALSATPVMAQTFSSNQTGQFNVKMQIQGQCILQTASDLNFGSTGIINANIDQSSTLVVQCTNGTP